MTRCITVRNVNSALSEGLWWLKTSGVYETSRNGPVIVSPEPVITCYQQPCERVLFSGTRDANPYFHLFESLWMLEGRNDLSWPLQFNSKFHLFSDDGDTIHGAYGHRWRHWPAVGDQLFLIIYHLKEHLDSRRAVLAMWDPYKDLCNPSRDIPCNDLAMFDCRGGVLNMTVVCRSNDLMLGCCGANAVHFSILLEYMAAYIGVPVGLYRQFSNNYHAYTEWPGYPSIDPDVIGLDDRYSSIKPFPLVQDPGQFDLELHRFMEDPLGDAEYKEPFFDRVAAPMYASWVDRKTKKNSGILAATAIAADDWRMACVEWIGRREGLLK